VGVRRLMLPLIIMVGFLPAGFGQQRPYRTDDADLLATGMIRASVGIEFLQGQRYSLSGLRGDLTRMGVASIQMGAGDYAEFQISGVAQDVLAISSRTDPAPIASQFSGNSTSDFGDLVLGTKLKISGEGNHHPAIAFKFAVELPNAKHDSGLGNDETEFYASLLIEKKVGRARFTGDLGFAILPSPVLQGRQTDPLTYGFAAVIPASHGVNVTAEISGRQGPPR